MGFLLPSVSQSTSKITGWLKCRLLGPWALCLSRHPGWDPGMCILIDTPQDSDLLPGLQVQVQRSFCSIQRSAFSFTVHQWAEVASAWPMSTPWPRLTGCLFRFISCVFPAPYKMTSFSPSPAQITVPHLAISYFPALWWLLYWGCAIQFSFCSLPISDALLGLSN